MVMSDMPPVEACATTSVRANISSKVAINSAVSGVRLPSGQRQCRWHMLAPRATHLATSSASAARFTGVPAFTGASDMMIFRGMDSSSLYASFSTITLNVSTSPTFPGKMT